MNMLVVATNQMPVGLYSSALLFCAVVLNVLLKSGPVPEGMSPQHWQINGSKNQGKCICKPRALKGKGTMQSSESKVQLLPSPNASQVQVQLSLVHCTIGQSSANAVKCKCSQVQVQSSLVLLCKCSHVLVKCNQGQVQIKCTRS